MAGVFKRLEPKRHTRDLYTHRKDQLRTHWESGHQQGKKRGLQRLSSSGTLIWGVKASRKSVCSSCHASCGVLLSSLSPITCQLNHQSQILLRVSLGAPVWISDVSIVSGQHSLLYKTIDSPSLNLPLTVPSLNTIISLTQQRRIMTWIDEKIALFTHEP